MDDVQVDTGAGGTRVQMQRKLARGAVPTGGAR
jgi:hypothetical protein